MTALSVSIVAASLTTAFVAVVVAIRASARTRWVRSDLDHARVRVDQTLELEGQLAQALDAMEMGVVLWSRNGRVVFRNRAADAFVAARHGNALVEAEVQTLLTGALDGCTGEREVELFGPPFTSFVVRAFPLAASEDGPRDPIGALALVEESTERRRLDQVRRDFVANISHELRTPIGAIGLLAETIRDEPDSEVVERLSDRMTHEAERVSRTIDDLLELSRIEFGEGTRIDSLDPLDVVEDAVGRIRAAAEQRAVGLSVEASRGSTIRGDSRQLVSAVFNLLDNAVKFSPPGATVEVHVEATADTVRISVADQGIGIPSRDLDRVFERFYRVDRARSRETGGTGLGLAIVRHVVSNNGGDVTVSSREGSGSVFTLVLPLVGSPEVAGVPEADARRPEPVEVGS